MNHETTVQVIEHGGSYKIQIPEKQIVLDLGDTITVNFGGPSGDAVDPEKSGFITVSIGVPGGSSDPTTGGKASLGGWWAAQPQRVTVRHNGKNIYEMRGVAGDNKQVVIEDIESTNTVNDDYHWFGRVQVSFTDGRAPVGLDFDPEIINRPGGR